MGRLHLVIGLVAWPLVAHADPAKLTGMTEVRTVTPDKGLIEEAIANDGAGQLAYLLSDGASQVEIHVIGVDPKDDWAAPVPLAGWPPTGDRVWFVGQGKKAKLFVTAPKDDGTEQGALVDGKGAIVHQWVGEAIVPVARGGKSWVAVRSKNAVTRYTLDKRGRRIGKPAKLPKTFKLDHWTGDGVVAVGYAEGDYDKKQDVRAPDDLGVLDLSDATPKLVRRPIDDPMKVARRFEILATDGDPGTFARVATDLTGVEVWKDQDRTAITLDQPFDVYDPKSLTYAVAADGTVWLGLSVDPWNRPAVDRKKADPEYFDLFKVSGDKATRVARRAAPKARFELGAIGDKLWLLEKNVGFDGGKSITIYTVP